MSPSESTGQPEPRFAVHGKALDLSVPSIMGVLNVTPDSFSDGGLYVDPDAAISRLDRMAEDGASIIDIGGESTRPGSEPVSEQVELDRVMPVVEKAVSRYPDRLFSIDTTKYEVAQAALAAGVDVVNDVSGLQREPRLAELCARYDAGLVIMHAQGTPQTMQQNPEYDNVVGDIKGFLQLKLEQARENGVQPVMIDPGIGFGKTLEHNLTLLRNLQSFRGLGVPVLVGASRKSMLGHILEGRPAEGRLPATLAVHYHAMMKGADVLRVHDVREAFDTVKVYNALHP